jgi:hypothetical protein
MSLKEISQALGKKCRWETPRFDLSHDEIGFLQTPKVSTGRKNRHGPENQD